MTSRPEHDRAHAQAARAGAAPVSFPTHIARIPRTELLEGQYRVRFARTAEQLDELLRLRFNVFNVELQEGLEVSHITGRDEDEFDAVCHHLIVEERDSGAIIGTYRLQTAEMANTGRGFYTASEFDLSGLASSIITHGVEIGRACIAAEHRRQRVLFALWKGLAAYLVHNRKYALFGCCSLTSQDPDEGETVMEWLRRNGHVAQGEPVHPHAKYACHGRPPDEAQVNAVRIPALFGTYLRYRSLVHGPPALDPRFGTIDYLVVCDARRLDARAMATFFGQTSPFGTPLREAGA